MSYDERLPREDKWKILYSIDKVLKDHQIVSLISNDIMKEFRYVQALIIKDLNK